ncbi:hypothetical protein [Bacillus subtilis]|uniref:hypothetical protein n=1 Tax=Bacillus subtilis TaxID=1423 RepID=UPI003F865058
MENNKKAFYLGLANLACKKEHLKAYISFPFKIHILPQTHLMYFLEDELSGC